MQESRLFKILYYLLDKGRATAPEEVRDIIWLAESVSRSISGDRHCFEQAWCHFSNSLN